MEWTLCLRVGDDDNAIDNDGDDGDDDDDDDGDGDGDDTGDNHENANGDVCNEKDDKVRLSEKLSKKCMQR